MSEISEEAAREALRAMVEELDGFRARLEDLHAQLPVPPEETAMPAGEEEVDFVAEARSAIECVLNDRIQPAIRDLAAAASSQSKRKGSE